MIPLTKQERIAAERQQNKWLLIQEVQKAHQQGKNVTELSRQYQLNWRTIKKYIDLKAAPANQRIRAKPIDRYTDEVIRLERAGETVKSIYDSIHKKGYQGTYSAVRTLVQTKRKERKYGAQPTISLPKRKLAAIIWKRKEELSDEGTYLLQRCMSMFPDMKTFYDSIQTFRKAVMEKDYPAFLRWLKGQLSNQSSPFHHYSRRLRSDLQAVKYAFMLTYSNGLLEGQINRLKTIKRLTYGRASLKLLEKRVLYRH